jgi:Flp pilus assembly protein TadG
VPGNNSIARSRRERGSALVEFAAVFTVLFTFLFAIMDLSRALYTYHFVADAAREGTRYAMVRGSTCTSWTTACPAAASDIQTYLKNVPAGINPASLTATTTWTPNNSPGSVVQVQVQYSFQPIFPFIPKTALVMTSTSQVVISQ